MKIHEYLCISALSLAVLVLAAGCGDNSCGPVTPPICGWVVGGSVNGFGTIMHTVDGGSTWARQGNSTSVPDVYITAVRAVDSLRAWAVGEAADGYGTILWTEDGGEDWNRVPQSAGIPDQGMLDLDVLNASTIWVVGSGNNHRVNII